MFFVSFATYLIFKKIVFVIHSKKNLCAHIRGTSLKHTFGMTKNEKNAAIDRETTLYQHIFNVVYWSNIYTMLKIHKTLPGYLMERC